MGTGEEKQVSKVILLNVNLIHFVLSLIVEIISCTFVAVFPSSFRYVYYDT